MSIDDCYGKNVRVTYEDHERDAVAELVGVFDTIERLGEPEIFYIGVVVADTPLRRRYVPRDDVLSIDMVR